MRQTRLQVVTGSALLVVATQVPIWVTSIVIERANLQMETDETTGRDWKCPVGCGYSDANLDNQHRD